MSYDTYLLNEAEKHNRDCEPTVVSSGKEYEGRDEDGNIEYSTSNTFNCETCDNAYCEYWSEFNDN